MLNAVYMLHYDQIDFNKPDGSYGFNFTVSTQLILLNHTTIQKHFLSTVLSLPV